MSSFLNINLDRSDSPLVYLKQTAKNYLDRETVGGVLLIIASIIALIIANSPLAENYHHILEYELRIVLSDEFEFGLSIEKWINDGLMAIFFLVAGLELKRELLVGELASRKSATLPLLLAIGGIVFPAIIFLTFNYGEPTQSAWGIPVATDIAYSLGIMGMLGKRVPGQLKALLVGLAIADDLGAVLIIALFYSHGLNVVYLIAVAAVYALMWFLNTRGEKGLVWYILPGLALWYFMLRSGIHPTVAGVLMAFVVPVKPKIDSLEFKQRTKDYASMLEKTDIENRDPLEDRRQRSILRKLERETRQSRPPLLRLENSLLGFNAYFIIPFFALANAGVALDISLGDLFTSRLALGIMIGLVVGKSVGITLFSRIGQAFGWVEVDKRLTTSHIFGMGLIAGIGFTMSLFITGLAFEDPDYNQISKISILLASVVAAVSGVVVLLTAKEKK